MEEKKFSELEEAVQPMDASLLVEKPNIEDVQVEVNETSPQDYEDFMSKAQFKDFIRKFKIPSPPQQVRENPKIGRNDPCPCGSGKKYKNCCLHSGEYEKLKPVEKKK